MRLNKNTTEAKQLEIDFKFNSNKDLPNTKTGKLVRFDFLEQEKKKKILHEILTKTKSF